METVEKILQDLYAIDPEFQKHEPRLRMIIAKLLKSKPDVRIDQEFVAGLRRQLLAQAELQKSAKPQTSFWKNMSLVFAGSTAVMLLLLGTYYFKTSTQPSVSVLDDSVAVFTEPRIDQLEKNAFGKLSAETVGGGRGQGGGGGGVPEQQALSAPVPSDKAGGAIEPSLYQPIQYRYEYTGDALSNLPAELPVYKRDKEALANVNGSQLLRQLSFGLFNPSKFSNLKLQNVTIGEDKDFGYMVNINMVDGNIYISENWERWPHPEVSCRDEQCYRSYQLKPEQIPTDDVIISLAKNFLDDHNIKTDAYGQPAVMDYWRQELASAADKSMVYIPDTIAVVFPLKVENKEVYDEGGNKTGLMVQVNVRHNRVSGVSELTSQRYLSSSYPTETDTKKLLGFAEKGTFRSFYYQEPNAKTVTVELGTPSISYIKFYQYKDGKTEELLVPAYIFPVLKIPEGQIYFQKNIVIPLVREILEDQPQPPVQILERATVPQQ